MKGFRGDLSPFVRLHEYLKTLPADELNHWSLLALANNPWFTAENVKYALEGIYTLLEPVALKKMMDEYVVNEGEPQKIGIIMAGNIPAVGFHDLLCVLLSGNAAYAKMSSSDTVILKKLSEKLIEFNPELKKRIIFTDQLKDMDAYIATGTNNSSRHFEYYFRNTPHIIRKNRTSVALISGYETEEKLIALGEDVFRYFGLGCRNVSHVFLPQGYAPENLLKAWEVYHPIMTQNKYMNNYEYNKAILLINLEEHLDAGFLLMKQSDSLFSPVSVLYYSFYNSIASMETLLTEKEDEIQCVVSDIQNMRIPTVPIGASQYPVITDFADGVDTMAFLCSLS